MTYHKIIAALFTVLIAFPVGAAGAVEKFITLVGTTSTDNSGLYGKILPLFLAKTGIKVRVVSVGTGRAINIAKNGDADVLLVHHRPSEDKFVAEGRHSNMESSKKENDECRRPQVGTTDEPRNDTYFVQLHWLALSVSELERLS